MSRVFLLLLAAALALSAQPPKNRAPLAPSAFYPLPLSSVKPAGWLLDQLKIQASAITGHLDEIWPDVGPNSAWLGGTGEGWERGPYYLDGLLPLAYTLDDPRLIAKVKPWVEWALTHQRPDGAIGPPSNKDWWPNMIMLKVLTQYQEATGDPRVIPFLEKYFAHHAALMNERPLHQWAIYRWQDQFATLLWLYNRNGDPALLDFARRLKAQGFDWRGHFENFAYPNKVPRAQTGLQTHGVNNAMGVKTSALWYLLSKDPADKAATAKMLDTLDRHHGLPNGMFSADEHYAGRSPVQGIETCAVVEEMFSLELALAALGDPALADRLEKIAYNALPASQTPDQWGHQYDQQPNQVLCSYSRRDWETNGPESNLFGLQPNFGCCTANLHQGWPKFVASLWMASPDDGLAIGAYAPSTVRTTVRKTPVVIEEQTEYPFRNTVQLVFKPSEPVAFPIHFRVPAWAAGAALSVNGQPLPAPKPGAYGRIDRQWRNGDRLLLSFPMPITPVQGFNQSVSIERGPLVFALRVEENWRQLRQTGPVSDWEVFPVSPWNYALRLDAANPAASFELSESPLSSQPFTTTTSPVVLKAKARRLPQWMLVNDSAAPPPASPVTIPGRQEQTGKYPEESITLIPYGAARLRITSFPVLEPVKPQ
ncbi:MAG: glycoside hydrolase family 127 protein [Acidobacteria bacterium]|nr:glycoside hydrolase family 127 protein [Acidobacteriota bacterium]